MKLSEWFNYQFQATTDSFAWAVAQIPYERHHISPPTCFGEWTVARHIFHMIYYERDEVLAYMHYWLGDAPQPTPNTLIEAEERAWEEAEQNVEQLLEEFHQVRSAQMALLRRIKNELWLERKLENAWGEVTLKWIVTRAMQHTAEHTSTILRMALFWDQIAAAEQAESKQDSQQRYPHNHHVG